MMLFRCAVLRQIPASGYVDLKEQALPLLAAQFNIRHLPQPTPTALPIRTLEQYITAMQCRYRRRLGRTGPVNPFDEDCRPTFAIVEEGASISAEARVHDAVILRGARVESKAIVVRSIVCPGAVVLAGQRVVGELVTASALVRG
jgi:NDP-sugar pyrophosphorylase family protein